MKLFRNIVILIALSISGSRFLVAYAGSNSQPVGVSKGIVKHKELVLQIIRNGNKQLINNNCFTPRDNSEPYLVADFIMKYYEFLSGSYDDMYAGFVRCGFIDDKTCAMFYKINGKENNRGESWNLRFEIDENNNILTDSFECWGLY